MPDNIDELFMSVNCHPCRIWEIMNGCHELSLSCLITMFPWASHSALYHDASEIGDIAWHSKLYHFKTNKNTMTLSCNVVHMNPLLDIDALALTWCISNRLYIQGKVTITKKRNNTEKDPCCHAKKFIIGQQRILETNSPFNIVISNYAYITGLSGNLFPVCAVDQFWTSVILNKGIFRCIFYCNRGYLSFIVW